MTSRPHFSSFFCACVIAGDLAFAFTGLPPRAEIALTARHRWDTRHGHVEIPLFSPCGEGRRHGTERKMMLLADSGDVVQSVVDAWSSYNVALEANPLVVKSLTASVILGAADLAGQTIEANQAAMDVTAATAATTKAIDVGRFVRFAIFGLVLQAPWNHFYYLLLDGVLPPTPEPFTATTGVKVVIDQFVQAPIFTVLIFGFLGLLEGKTLDSIKRQLDDDYVDTMIANWKLWVPATVVNIAFVPPILRVLFLNCVFFFWSIFLSLKLNASKEGQEI